MLFPSKGGNSMKISKRAQRLETRRKEAVGLIHKEKKTVREVSKQYRVTTQAVYKWLWRYQKEGFKGLSSKPRPGRPGKLNPKKKKSLETLLLKGAKRAGFSTDLWTCPRIADVIYKSFGICYHIDHIGKLLRTMGWSPQRPVRKAIERNEEQIRNWIKVQWPRIKKKPGN